MELNSLCFKSVKSIYYGMRASDLKFYSVSFCLSILILVAGCQKKPDAESSSTFMVEAVERTPDTVTPAVEIASPAEDEIVSNDFSVYFAAAGIELSNEGEHLHFMLDDGDIIEHYDGNSPSNFTDVTDGQHLIRVFAVKKDHTSYKSSKSVDMVTFYVSENKGELPIEIENPMLFLNIPSGSDETDDSNGILLDFWVLNAKLGIYDYKVGYTLDGHEGSLFLWETYLISGLSNGKHKIMLDLIDPNGKPVLGNFNHTVRTFNITK